MTFTVKGTNLPARATKEAAHDEMRLVLKCECKRTIALSGARQVVMHRAGEWIANHTLEHDQ